MFAQQAARAGEVPKRGDLGEYLFFILNQDGKYILPRLPRSDEGENLWREYELKLIYEMQKRRDGWIYYPDRARPGLRDGQYAIRYVYLDRQGWIIAAEGYVPGAWTLLQGFLTPKLFLGLFLVVCLAFGMMLLNAFWHFRKVMKAILRSQENNFIAVAAQPKPIEPTFKSDDRTLSGGSIKNTGQQILPKSRAEFPAGTQERPSEAERPVETAEPTTPRGPQVSEPETAPAFDPRKLDDLGAITIDTADIRSPLLKKVIEEMREKK
jgi:hypothetical protein